MSKKITSFCLVLGLCVPLVSSGKEIWAKSFLNQKAPALVVEKWLSAKPKLEGKFVLIDFWATWCGPCRRAIPELNEIQRKFGDRLVVIGISDEDEATVKAMREPVINYAVAIDPRARMKNQIEVKGIPHVILIDPTGVVRWEGFPLLAGEELTPTVVAGVMEKYSKH